MNTSSTTRLSPLLMTSTSQLRLFTYDNRGLLPATTTRTLAVFATTNRLSAATYDASGRMLAWGGHAYDWDGIPSA